MSAPTDILKGKILIVDDQEANVLLLQMILRRAGYASITATTSPDQVCRLHLANRYDLIVLDLDMPDLDGFQVMEQLKAIESGGYLPVLVIAAQADHKLRALGAGAKDFISKPFSIPELLARVHNQLEVRLVHEAARTYGRALESLARHDPLTGLANRRLAEEQMEAALAHGRTNHTAIAVLYLDLDGFKGVNDTFGHGGGDEVLKAVAARLEATVRRKDTVARLGGDEFMVVLWHVASEADAARVAQKAIEAVARPYAFEGHTIRVTASVGIALYSAEDEGTDGEALMKCADGALRAAKQGGKNAVRVSTPTMVR